MLIYMLGNPELNDTGVFGVTHNIMDPYSDKKKFIKMRCYFITEPGNMMPEIPGNNDKEGWIRLYIEANVNGDISMHLLQEAEWQNDKGNGMLSTVPFTRIRQGTLMTVT